MPRAKGLSAKIRSWDLLNENVKPLLPDMAHMQPLQTELQAFLDEVRGIDNEQEEARSKLRDLVRRRQELERQGEVVRRRMQAHLRGSFGYTNEQLIKFGVKPRPRVIRRKKAPETPPASTVQTPQEPQSA
jgi:hypothetical protein